MSNLMLCNFIEITLRHRCSPAHLLYIFRIPFPESSSGGLLPTYDFSSSSSVDKKSFLKLFTSLSLNMFRVFATYCQWFFSAFTILLLTFTSSSSRKEKICYLLLEFDTKLTCHLNYALMLDTDMI